MRFKDLLNDKLGPMKDLVGPTPRPEAPDLDPERLWYRRAAGLEVRLRPEESWREASVRTFFDAAPRSRPWRRLAPWPAGL